MKLNEVDSSDNDLVLLMRNLVAQANSKEQPSYLSWAALNSLMQNVGDEQFDYDSFKAQYDASPLIQKLVHKFDARGIELKTLNTEPKKSENGQESNISKMAKSATKRRTG
jgi:hypothetical protein